MEVSMSWIKNVPVLLIKYSHNVYLDIYISECRFNRPNMVMITLYTYQQVIHVNRFSGNHEFSKPAK